MRHALAAAIAGCIVLPAAANVPDVGIPPVSSKPLAVAPRAEPDADGRYVVDVLVLLTAAADTATGGGSKSRALAGHLLDEANRYFANSRMPVRYRLAGVERTAATSEAASYAQNQADLAASSAVRAARNRSAADLVVLLRTNQGDSSCGLGGLFNGGVQTDPPTNVDPERDAFAVVGAIGTDEAINCGGLEHLFAHELGHNMGGGHQSALTGVYISDGGIALGPYWKPYAHASYCGLAADGTRNNTVMMGGIGVQGTYVQGGDLRGDYFSNPALTVDGLPCGVTATGQSEVEADNARSITEAAPYVAAYRGPPGAKSSVAAGTLPALGILLLGLAALVRRRLGAAD